MWPVRLRGSAPSLPVLPVRRDGLWLSLDSRDTEGRRWRGVSESAECSVSSHATIVSDCMRRTLTWLSATGVGCHRGPEYLALVLVAGRCEHWWSCVGVLAVDGSLLRRHVKRFIWICSSRCRQSMAVGCVVFRSCLSSFLRRPSFFSCRFFVFVLSRFSLARVLLFAHGTSLCIFTDPSPVRE